MALLAVRNARIVLELRLARPNPTALNLSDYGEPPTGIDPTARGGAPMVPW
jgi:hypothetical protein